MMILDKLARGALQPQDAFDQGRDHDYSSWEERHMDVHHPVATVVVMTEWGFAQDVIGAVRGHAVTAGLPTRSAVLLHLACAISEAMGCGLPGETGNWASTAVKLQFVGLPDDDLDIVAAEAKEKLDQFKTACAT